LSNLIDTHKYTKELEIDKYEEKGKAKKKNG